MRGELNYLLMAYSLGNIYTKNYWNWRTTGTFKIIVDGWVVYFFGTSHSVHMALGGA